MDPKFVLPKITVEETPSNGRDDQHVLYRVLRDGEPISDWVGESRMYEIADEARERAQKEDPLRPEERRVLEIEDELAALWKRLDVARRAAAPGCQHPAIAPLGYSLDGINFDTERCGICYATRPVSRLRGSGPWVKCY